MHKIIFMLTGFCVKISESAVYIVCNNFVEPNINYTGSAFC